MDKIWQWFKEEIKTWNLSPRLPHEEERRDDYDDRIYGEAQCIYRIIIDNMEKNHPEIKEGYEDYEMWYDEYTDDVMSIIIENISVV